MTSRPERQRRAYGVAQAPREVAACLALAAHPALAGLQVQVDGPRRAVLVRRGPRLVVLAASSTGWRGDPDLWGLRLGLESTGVLAGRVPVVLGAGEPGELEDVELAMVADQGARAARAAAAGDMAAARRALGL